MGPKDQEPNTIQEPNTSFQEPNTLDLQEPNTFDGDLEPDVTDAIQEPNT